MEIREARFHDGHGKKNSSCVHTIRNKLTGKNALLSRQCSEM